MIRCITLLTTMLLLTVSCSGASDTETTQVATDVATPTEVPFTPTITSASTLNSSLTPTLVPNIEIINYSGFSKQAIKKWVALAESKMKSRESRIFAFIYPVGKMKTPEKRIRSDYANRVFREHDVLLSKDEIESILGEIERWFEGDPCLDSEDKRQYLSDYKTWLEQGGDTSTMHPACERTRIVAMAITESMRDHETIEDLQSFLFHEFYHAFQQDVEMEGECSRKRNEAGENSNSVWMNEGGAHYFATALAAELHGKTNYRSQILEIASLALKRKGDSERMGHDTEPDKWGAAALSLMIELNMITEESILNGSLFHECARELEFDHTSAEIQQVKNSWYLIENNSGIFQFKEEALTK